MFRDGLGKALEHRFGEKQLRELWAGEKVAEERFYQFLSLPGRKVKPSGSQALLTGSKGQDQGKWPQVVPEKV